jgi:hypothetical protein
MTDPLKLMLDAGAVPATSFPPDSRYHGAPVDSYDPRDGDDPVTYVHRRFVPRPERLAETGRVPVAQGDRIDLVAERQLGDPALYWRLCDANGVLDPAELEQVGRWVRVTLPEGIPGAPRA